MWEPSNAKRRGVFVLSLASDYHDIRHDDFLTPVALAFFLAVFSVFTSTVKSFVPRLNYANSHPRFHVVDSLFQIWYSVQDRVKLWVETSKCFNANARSSDSKIRFTLEGFFGFVNVPGFINFRVLRFVGVYAERIFGLLTIYTRQLREQPWWNG